MNTLPRLSLLAALLALIAGASAAPEVNTPQPPVMASKEVLAAGKRIAAQGSERGAGSCNSCHGPAGKGDAAKGIPHLAGMPAPYIIKQLQDYLTGTRENGTMGPHARKLTGKERRAVAAWYASLPAPPPAFETRIDTEGFARGEQLVNEGDPKLRVGPCADCHGDDALGLRETAMPFLAGQHASYLRNSMETWRKGTRHNDPSLQMQAIARRLAPADIDAIITYLGRP